MKLRFAFICVLIVIVFALLVVGLAEAEERPPEPELVYLPLVHNWRPTPQAEAIPASGPVPGYVTILVTAPGCSSVWVEFVGVDREVYPPTIYHSECVNAQEDYSRPTQYAYLLAYLNSPMTWTGFVVTVYYPDRAAETIQVRGLWNYAPLPH